MNYAPVILLVYGRLDHTVQTVEYLKKNYLAAETELFVFSDFHQNDLDKDKVLSVREYIKTINGFKKINIIKNNFNKGIDLQTKDAVSLIINKYGRVIILEDDCLTSRNFLNYMNEMLRVYEKNKEIAMIAGFKAPYKFKKEPVEDIYFYDGVSSWGWGTWRDRWNSIDWNYYKKEKIFENKIEEKEFKNKSGIAYNCLKIDPTTWDITFNYWLFKNKKLVIYPKNSKIKNIGIDGSGVHFRHKNEKFLPNDFNLNDDTIMFKLPKEIKVDKNLEKEIKKFNKLRFINNIGIFLKKVRLYDKVKPIKDRVFRWF